jgi:hypothetical protein
MIGRREFGKLGLGLLGAAAVGRTAFAADDKPASEHAHDEQDLLFAACAKACSDCQRECDSCAAHCAHLLAEGHKEHLLTLATCQDCADFCAAAAQIVARGGPFAALICESCAEACNRCATACEKFPDDERMQACAEECRKCEEACKKMLPHAGHVG